MRRVEYKSVTGQLRTGYFHGFSQDYEEFENGPGNYPVAIIEEEDGSILLVYAKNIKLLDRPVYWVDLPTFLEEPKR